MNFPQHLYETATQGVRSRLTELGYVVESEVERILSRLGDHAVEVGGPVAERVANRFQGADWGAYVGNNDEYILAGVIIGSLVFLVIVLQFFNHRRKMAEMRLKTLEALARDGHLTPKQVEEFMTPRKQWIKRWLVFAWFTLIGSIGLVVAGAVGGGRDGEEMIVVGVVAAIGAIGILATPIMLREYRRQGAI